MYRLSPSKIDSFRIYKDQIFEMSKDQFIERLTGRQETTEAMQFGTDVHEFIENGNIGGLMKEEIEYLLPFKNKWEHKAKEEWVTLNLFEGCKSLMRLDMLDGVYVEDIKVSGRFWGVDFYEQSAQWKMYLMALNLPVFTYHIFQKKGTKRPHKFDYHSFSFFGYVGMEQEITQLAKGLIEFCELHGIEDCIKEKKLA